MCIRDRLKTVTVLLTLLALACGGLLYCHVSHPYRAARRHIVRDIGPDRLQAWAVSVLKDPKRSGCFDKYGMMLPEFIPDFITPVDGPLTFICGDTGKTVTVPMEIHLVEGRKDIGLEEHLLLPMGGGFYHYGFRIGRKGFVPREDSQFSFERIADGVWGLHER